mgnify:CR=1 FL=1
MHAGILRDDVLGVYEGPLLTAAEDEAVYAAAGAGDQQAGLEVRVGGWQQAGLEVRVGGWMLCPRSVLTWPG